MMESAADRLASIKALDGDRWVYFDGDELTEVWAIFENAFQRVEFGLGPPVESSGPQLTMALDTITAPKKGDQLFRGALTAFEGEFEYEVVSPQTDESSNMAVLMLRAL